MTQHAEENDSDSPNVDGYMELMKSDIAVQTGRAL